MSLLLVLGCFSNNFSTGTGILLYTILCIFWQYRKSNSSVKVSTLSCLNNGIEWSIKQEFAINLRVLFCSLNQNVLRSIKPSTSLHTLICFDNVHDRSGSTLKSENISNCLNFFSFFVIFYHIKSWLQGADSGFPKDRAPTSYLAKYYRKLHENQRKLAPWQMVLSSTRDVPGFTAFFTSELD